MYKRILVPVDGSPSSTNALTAALQMFRNGGSRLRLVHLADEISCPATTSTVPMPGN